MVSEEGECHSCAKAWKLMIWTERSPQLEAKVRIRRLEVNYSREKGSSYLLNTVCGELGIYR